MDSKTKLRDPLTGALLRASLEDRITAEAERARRHGEHLSILFVDLDHLKSVNDAFGHARGDAVLRDFAHRLTAELRASDVVFRYGGDEFIVLLPHTAKRKAELLADRLLQVTRSAQHSMVPELSLTTSIGISSLPEDATTSGALIEKADTRLYEAKRRGRDRWVSEDPTSDDVPSFHESSRLVERDESVEVLNRFFERLETKRRGVLVITGEAGAGTSRFLQETARAARLRGYLVVNVDARRALTGRAHGALAEAFREQQLPLPVAVSEREFSEALQVLLTRQEARGIVFTVDRYTDLDRETQELLQWLLASPSVESVACAYVARREEAWRSVALEAPMTEALQLAPLTRGGTRLWLRHALAWEAADDFVGWLHMQTRGLPGLLRDVVTHMVRRGALVKEPQGWSFAVDFKDVPLEGIASMGERSPHHNLPLVLTTFVGRTDELAEAKRGLRRGPLLTILGPGGVGKTRLALQTAAEVADEFADGVFHVPLASVPAADLLPHAMADALQFSFHGETSPKAQLLDYLRNRRMLIVLDNFEHLLDGAAFLTQILSHAAGVRALVTSRERLRVQGEEVLVLGGLRVDRCETDRLIEGPSAVQLFIRTALRTDPRFDPGEDDREAIVRTCRAVEGMPLAIEMAAGWVSALDCREIAEAVEDSLDMVNGRLRDAPARHRSIRAVFGQSWQRLSAKERDLLAALSVFPSGFSKEAARRVAGASIPLLSALVDKSFIRRTATGCFESHELLRRCAAEKLAEELSRHGSIHARHCAYYAGFLHGFEALQTADDWNAALEEIGAEIDNLRSAWQWAVDHSRVDCIEACADTLSRFYDARSFFEEGYDVFGTAATALTTREETPNGSVPPANSLAYAKVLVRQGMFARRLARAEEANAVLHQGLELLRDLDSPRDTSLALRQLGIVARDLGQYSEARAYLEESKAASTKAECALDLALSLNELGTIALRLGEYQEAREFYGESIEACDRAGDRAGAAAPVSNLAGVLFQLGEFERGRQLLERALEIYREAGSRHAIAGCLNNLGLLAWRTGDPAKASKLLREALTIQREIGERSALACGLNNLGVISSELSQYDQARDRFQEALEVATEAGDPLRAAVSDSGLGDVAYAVGRYDESAERYRKSLRTALGISAIPQAVEALVSLAKLHEAQGRHDRALELIAHAARHPAAQEKTRDTAERLEAEISSRLPASRAETAVEMGSSKRLDDIAAQILAETVDQEGVSSD